MNSKTLLGVLATVATVGIASLAHASETTSYTYDALGRLVKASSTGTVNNGLQSDTVFDPAGNRTSQTVTGSVNNAPPSRGIVIVPLNGYTIIPLR